MAEGFISSAYTIMIDTIHLSGDFDYSLSEWLCNELDTYEFYSSKYQDFEIRGKSKNLDVRTIGGNLLIKGSLQKYHLDNNYVHFSKGDLLESINSLRYKFCLNDNTSIRRLDFGGVIELSCPLSEYIPHLQGLSRFDKHVYNTSTISFENKQRTLILYDKNIESKLFNNNNLCRIELRYKNSSCLKYHVNPKGLVLNDLKDDQIMERLFNNWKEEVNKIDISEPIQLSDKLDFTSLTAFKNSATKNWYSTNSSTIERELMYAYESKEISSVQKYRILNFLRSQDINHSVHTINASEIAQKVNDYTWFN